MSLALQRMNKVEHVENDFMDDGKWMVRLVSGYAFQGAAKCPADDPKGASALHYKGGTVRELQLAIKHVDRCYCGACEADA